MASGPVQMSGTTRQGSREVSNVSGNGRFGASPIGCTPTVGELRQFNLHIAAVSLVAQGLVCGEKTFDAAPLQTIVNARLMPRAAWTASQHTRGSPASIVTAPLGENSRTELWLRQCHLD